MTMTDDLIRRGYAYDVVRNSISMSDALDAIDALPASEAFTALTEKNQSLALDHLAALGQAAEQIEALTAERNQAWKMVAEADTRLGQSLADALQDKADNARLRADMRHIARAIRKGDQL